MTVSRPGHARMASPYDLDARWGVKREEFWLGYKLHVTETCDDPPACTCRPGSAGQPGADAAGAGGRPGAGREHDRGCAQLVLPNLITNVATTDATVTDTHMTGAIHDLAEKNLVPGRHYLDSGYLSAAPVVSALTTRGIAVVGPLLADTSAQARAGQGYARAHFTVDYDTQTVICPQGKTARSWSPGTQHGKDAIVAIFSITGRGPCSCAPLPSGACSRYRPLTWPTPRPPAGPRKRPSRLGRLRPPRRGQRHHAPRRQLPRAARPLPRPAQDPSRPRVHGLPPQPAPPGGLLDGHAAGPAANQPPGTPRTPPRCVIRNNHQDHCSFNAYPPR